MNDETNVVFVDSHAEGVRSTDDAHRALHKGVKDFLFVRRREFGVKRLGPPFGVRVFNEERREAAGFARGAVNDDCGFFVGQYGREAIKESSGLFGWGDVLHGKMQIAPFDAARKNREIAGENRSEAVRNVADDVGFGGGRESLDGRDRRVERFGQLPDDAHAVKVVRTEVVSPFGKAVCFVKDPAADAPREKNSFDGGVSQLFRGKVKEGNVAFDDAIHHVAALGHRQEP